jgi:hypothetical protein
MNSNGLQTKPQLNASETLWQKDHRTATRISEAQQRNTTAARISVPQQGSAKHSNETPRQRDQRTATRFSKAQQRNSTVARINRPQQSSQNAERSAKRSTDQRGSQKHSKNQGSVHRSSRAQSTDAEIENRCKNNAGTQCWRKAQAGGEDELKTSHHERLERNNRGR